MPYKDKKKQQDAIKKAQLKISLSLSKVSEQHLIDYVGQHKPINSFLRQLVISAYNNENKS